jgi:rhodanese-related sulfurtransferase
MAIPEITVDELAQLLPKDVRVFDVREPSEYDEGHVPGAVLLPLGQVPDSVAAFRGAGPAYVVCKSGGRSMRACEFLAAQGVDAINIAGGTLAWIAAGHPVVTGDQPS